MLIFPGPVSFAGAHFSHDCDFSQAIFFGNANFSGTTFASRTAPAEFIDYPDRPGKQAGAKFGQAVFLGQASFERAVFAGKTLFGNACFWETATFEKAQFRAEFRAGGAKFRKEAIFKHAQFRGPAYFGSMSAPVKFPDWPPAPPSPQGYGAPTVSLPGELDPFGGNSDQASRYFGNLDMSETRFLGPARFTDADVRSLALFERSRFSHVPKLDGFAPPSVRAQGAKLPVARNDVDRAHLRRVFASGRAPVKMKSDVFVSYAREDRPKAAQIVAALKAAQLEVWWDHGLKVGDKWSSAIDAAIEGAPAFVVLWSPHSVAADGFVRREVTTAAQAGKAIFGIAVAPCRIPTEYVDLQFIDMAGAPDLGAHDSLREVIEQVRARVATSR